MIPATLMDSSGPLAAHVVEGCVIFWMTVVVEQLASEPAPGARFAVVVVFLNAPVYPV